MTSMEETYNGKCILVTGTTGFLGKVLLEKLLYSVTGLSRIYLLIRGKRGSKLNERFKKEIIESPCFDRLRQKHGHNFDQFIAGKVTPIQGDMLKEKLGLSQQDEEQLVNNVDYIMNCAASIDFNARLDDAININIRGCMKMLELAKKMKKLLNFTHVSTCYVNCNLIDQDLIEEKIYSKGDPLEELKSLESMPLKDLVNDTTRILGVFPNTYTFTKNLCQRILEKLRGELSLTILRPAIIINSYEQPFEGWVDSIAAAVALFFYCGLGIIREIWGDPNITGDIIPVDLVSNYIIACTAYNSNTHKLQIFHSGCSHRNPITWRMCEEQVKKYWLANPTSVTFAKPAVRFENRPMHFKFDRIRRRIPPVVYNRLATILGLKYHVKLSQKALKTMSKGYQIQRLFRFFFNHQYIFQANNVDKVLDWMDPKDRTSYNFDPAAIDMRKAMSVSNYGIQKFIMKQNVQVESMQSTNLLNKKEEQTYFSDLKWAFRQAGKKMPKNSISNFKDEILRSSRVQEAILKQTLSKNEFQQEDSNQFSANRRAVQKLADGIVGQMFGTFSMPVVRLEAWILTKFFKSIYEKIIFSQTVFENLRKIEDEMRIPIILAPTHKSYLDFMILSYLFFSFKLKSPYVASNEVLLRMTLIPHLLRSSGAFFIKNEEIKKNKLYKAILEQFIIKILSDGNNMEFFLENSRSRTGKILDVDFSIVSIIVDSILDEYVEDACIVPVTINYEKVLEGDTFPEQLLGEEKVEESFLRVLKTYKLLKTNFGRVYVQFSEPIFIKEYIKKNTTTSFNPRTNKQHRLQLVNSLGNQIVHRLTSKLVIMSTSVVCTAILMNRKGVTEDLLMKNVHWISKEVMNRGYKIGGINQNSPNIAVRNAVMHVSEITKTKKNVFEVQIGAGEEYKKLLMLSYYRNMLIHVFLPQAFIGCAQQSFGKELSQKEGVSVERLQDKALFLSKILKNEFIIERELRTSADFKQLLETLVSKKILTYSSDQKILTVSDNEKMMMLYCSLLWPYIECYWVTIVYLISMKSSPHQIQDVQLEKFKQYIQWYAQSLYGQKIVQYYEACSLETIKNAVQTYTSMGIIEIKKTKKEMRVELVASQEVLTELEGNLKNFLKNVKLISYSDLARISISGDSLLSNPRL